MTGDTATATKTGRAGQLTMSIGPAKCGDPRVTNPVQGQEEEAEGVGRIEETLAYMHSSTTHSWR